MGRLDDKIAIVTGAGQGIGRAIAEKLTADGGTVVVADVNEHTAHETAETLGGDSLALLTDVTSRGSVDAGRVGSSGEAVYSAAKGGVIAFTKAMAREMARHQVNVNCVCPGPTDTALFASMGDERLRESLVKAIPFRRLGEPEDVANTVAYLVSDEAGFVTGQTVSVSGGLTMC